MNISSTFRVIIFVSVASVLVVNASPSPDMMRDANFRFGKFIFSVFIPFFFAIPRTYVWTNLFSIFSFFYCLQCYLKFTIKFVKLKHFISLLEKFELHIIYAQYRARIHYNISMQLQEQFSSLHLRKNHQLINLSLDFSWLLSFLTKISWKQRFHSAQ